MDAGIKYSYEISNNEFGFILYRPSIIIGAVNLLQNSSTNYVAKIHILL